MVFFLSYLKISGSFSERKVKVEVAYRGNIARGTGGIRG